MKSILVFKDRCPDCRGVHKLPPFTSILIICYLDKETFCIGDSKKGSVETLQRQRENDKGCPGRLDVGLDYWIASSPPFYLAKTDLWFPFFFHSLAKAFRFPPILPPHVYFFIWAANGTLRSKEESFKLEEGSSGWRKDSKYAENSGRISADDPQTRSQRTVRCITEPMPILFLSWSVRYLA